MGEAIWVTIMAPESDCGFWPRGKDCGIWPRGRDNGIWPRGRDSGIWPRGREAEPRGGDFWITLPAEGLPGW